MKTLGDLFEITSSKRVFKEDWKTNGVPFYRAREIVKLAENGFVNNELFISEEMFKEYSEKYGLPKSGDIMVTGVGTLGICYVVKNDDRFYFKDGNIIWLKSTGKANSRYVEYAFKSDFLRKQIDDSVGATVGTYTIIKAKSTKIPLPPLPEQQHIVSILDETFAAIAKAKANAEQNLKNAKELFESYLQKLFEKKGDGWEIKPLGEVSKINYGYTEKASFDEVGPKFLRITDIQENGVDWETVPYCKCSDKDLPKYKLETGDIVFARTGATTGKSYLIDNPPNSVFASYLIRLRMNSINEFIPEFISYFFQTKTYWDKINAGISGSAQGGFNATKLGELEFHFPKSKEAQLTIVRQLDALRAETQKLETIYQQKLLNLEELKKSVLQRAFAGELT